MNIYHYRHIMVANTPGKLNIICATTHAKNQCSLVYMLLRIHQETAIRINIRRTEITLYLTL